MLKPYEQNVAIIRAEITSIGKAVLKANKESLEAMKSDDAHRMKDVNISVKKLSQKSNEIDNLIVKTLALYSPEARDLREMVAFLKITNELVRAGSNTKTFLKTFKQSFNDDINTKAILEYAIPLQKASTLALEITVSMIENYDEKTIEENYNRVLVEESKIEDLYSMVEKNILKMITKHLELSKDYFDLLSSFRRLEKIAGRSASIANLLHFAQVGGEIEHS